MQCAVQWLEWKFHFNQLWWNIMMFYGAGEPRKPAYPEDASGVQLKLTHFTGSRKMSMICGLHHHRHHDHDHVAGRHMAPQPSRLFLSLKLTKIRWWSGRMNSRGRTTTSPTTAKIVRKVTSVNAVEL